MTPADLEDEAARPKLPPDPGLSPQQRAHGRRLAQIHDMYRGELDAVAALLAELRVDGTGGDRLATAVEGMQLTRNLALFGTVCGRDCALLQHHHDIEERWMFPAIAEHASDAVQAVLDRLIAEHRVIHDLIECLRQTATKLARNPDSLSFSECAADFERLDRAIRSHFGYEETQLETPLGRHAIPI
ncbi:hemerythrin domain-containing protein [Paracoccus homiensis]|uniref:Hemerythrin HHE cation binding domain-containing protein n=1 Tax=Paracoccus homiensis TaxID=364199 RepID=A0A1I0BVY1_9RHOB|nr:hemerythrin domain-containing protein [Paracoccus homiensis]SET11235.1 Hemerythrin HHE cation binding domain-containing protein [Paracoccus homiensis]